MVEMERGVLDLERGAVGRDGTFAMSETPRSRQAPQGGPACEINAAGEGVRGTRELQPTAQIGGVEVPETNPPSPLTCPSSGTPVFTGKMFVTVPSRVTVPTMLFVAEVFPK
jgi:hypothetical protein